MSVRAHRGPPRNRTRTRRRRRRLGALGVAVRLFAAVSVGVATGAAAIGLRNLVGEQEARLVFGTLDRDLDLTICAQETRDEERRKSETKNYL